ncbi:MAG: hypothetical protein ACTSYL_03490 [Candidatus Thorarchaeota archaeon]
MEPRTWVFGRLTITLRLGPYGDSEMDAALKADNIPLGVPLSPTDTSGNMGLTAKEDSSAKRVEYWKRITIHDEKRRTLIFNAVTKFLQEAERKGDRRVAVSTLGPEIGMVPGWETAEEIAKAVYHHGNTEGTVDSVDIITTAVSQFNSFIFPLDNIEMFVG